LGASFVAPAAGAAAFVVSAAAFVVVSVFFAGAAGLLQPTAQNNPKLKTNANATNFFMGSPSQKNRLIGYTQQDTVLPAVPLDTDHWAIIPHKVQ
jgi:hypothetical protein